LALAAADPLGGNRFAARVPVGRAITGVIAAMR